VNISRIPERERNGEGTRNEADLSKVCIGNREIKYERIYKRQEKYKNKKPEKGKYTNMKHIKREKYE
jgi:hypothetical protein